MREILFRGKSKAQGSEWLYGDVLIYENLAQIWETINSRKHNSVVSLETVGQYTGLTDKNGKKIFEGDIVKDEQAQMLGKVVYATAADGFDGMAGFMVDDIDDGLQNYNGCWHLVEGIGNIHDNPELLESEVQAE